jgi:hypothetical protein
MRAAAAAAAAAAVLRCVPLRRFLLEVSQLPTSLVAFDDGSCFTRTFDALHGNSGFFSGPKLRLR